MGVENKSVTVAYRMYTMEDGCEEKEPAEVCDVRNPFRFVSGLGIALKPFEDAVTSLESGEEFNFVIPSAEAYGEYNKDLAVEVERGVFEVNGKFDHVHVYEGAVVPMKGGDGSTFHAVVTEIGEKTVMIDLNHPLAGQDLRFVGKVIDIHTASNTEISAQLEAASGCGSSCGGCGGCGGNDGGCGGGCGSCGGGC